MNQHYSMDEQQHNPLADLIVPGKIEESQRDVCSRIWERMNRFQHRNTQVFQQHSLMLS